MFIPWIKFFSSQKHCPVFQTQEIHNDGFETLHLKYRQPYRISKLHPSKTVICIKNEKYNIYGETKR